jgi:hypothetical protein
MPDCPACKYGTLVAGETEDTMRCIDCKAVHTVKRLVELHVLPNTTGQAGSISASPETAGCRNKSKEE